MITIIGMLASIAGFCIALYIYWKQQAKKPLMCPRKAPCETVISSPQATTFGFSNTILGMVYYFVMFFLLLCIYIGGASKILQVHMLLLSAGGFVFSAYLVQVQKVIIKQWCVWCLGSAAMATTLFIVAVMLFLYL